jgi:two-component system, NtrC family, sensor histidine kinase HydH
MGAALERVRRVVSKAFALRVIGLALSIAGISVLRYVTAPSPSFLHELSLRLYYLPILVCAYWYGAAGGLLIASVSSVAYIHRVLDVTPTFDPSRYAEVVVFYLIGLSVGVLASAERNVSDRYRRTAATLEAANRELRDSYEQIRRIDRLKTLGEVATGLAHEIRHPLASIGGALEIIESRSREDSPEGEFSRLAMAEVRRLDLLVWEFLKYARPHDPELRTVVLHEVVTQVVTLLRVEAERACLTLKVEQETAVDVEIDPLQFEQVLLNVILNAIQATPPGRQIVVREHLEEPDVIVDVVDRGSGIAAEHLPSIFNPFFTTKEKGTGLGLAIAHHIVVAHRGRLLVHETSPRGTTVRIRLPASRPSRARLSPRRQT